MMKFLQNSKYSTDDLEIYTFQKLRKKRGLPLFFRDVLVILSEMTKNLTQCEKHVY